MSKSENKIEVPKSKIILTKQLVSAIKEGRENSERFCFILGAGASVESGISTGNELECKWMKYLDEEIGLDEVEETAKNLKDEEKLQYDFGEIRKIWDKEKLKEKPYIQSKYYFDIYTLRFYPNQRNGYFFLQKLMEGKEPSFGYWPLVEMLTDGGGSNLVITTNFDSLVEDALFIYKDIKPLVINHELLASYASDINIKRPIIAKIHRGLFFDPLNGPENTNKLQGNWGKILSYIFNSYTPIVIGYGGGDHSLMDMLKDTNITMRNGLYWCYMEEYGLPADEIRKIVLDKNGYFVQTAGFDATMLAIGVGLYGKQISDLKSVREKLKKRAEDRINNVHETIAGFESKIKDITGIGNNKSIKELMENVKKFNENRNDSWKQRIAKGGMTAIDYYWKGREEKDKNNYLAALEYYGKAIELDENYVDAYNSRAILLEEMKEYKKALEDYSRAIELDENYVYAYNNRGGAYKEQEEYEKAIQDYNRAIELDENCVDAYNGRGNVYKKQGEYEKAIQDYNRAIELDENYVDAYNGRGNVYYDQEEYEKALDDYNKALELDSKYVLAYKNRAKLYRKLGRISEAEADEKMAESLKRSNNKK